MAAPDSITTTYHKELDALPQHRKHIILIDGTWNDETGVGHDGLVTNIVHLQRIFLNIPGKQIVRYHRGVGNDNDNNKLANFWKGLTGHGVEDVVDRAYARFVQDWQAGDSVFIFGFSRGAAAARMLCSQIEKMGIPEEITIVMEPRNNYESRVVEQRLPSYRISGLEKSKKVPISFLGVWDTVSALGLGMVLRRFFKGEKKDLFTDNHIAGNIQKAVHLVAIDETRNPFVPSLMNHKPGITHEVWFPGVHSDIGGSYAEDEIAKLSLDYMLGQVRAWAADKMMPPFEIDHMVLPLYTSKATEKAHFHFHGLGLGRSIRKMYIQKDGQPDYSLKPKIHHSYYDLCTLSEVYSVVEKRRKRLSIKFQYMPFNVKLLEDNMEIVK